MEKETYCFFEWLIPGKGYSEEQWENATSQEKHQLIIEYKEFKATLKVNDNLMKGF